MATFMIFMIGFVVGGFIEYILTFLWEMLEKKPLKINHRFTVAKRVSLLSLPIWGLIALLFTKGSHSFVILFLLSAVIGTLLEGILGKFIKRFFGVRIWTYKYGAWGNFTSFYALPYWGAAGLVFALLGKVLGL